MKDIFTDFYNTILGFFRQTEKKEENAKDVACNRLRVVLMQDRTNLTPELLQRMRQELIDLLSKYVEMDKDALELNFDQEGGQMALMLSIPVLRAKDEAEIDAEEADEDSTEAIENDDSGEDVENEPQKDSEESEKEDTTYEEEAEEPEIIEDAKEENSSK